MDLPSLQVALADLNLSAIRFLPSIDSTNDEARRWITAGAADRSLIVASEQTAGRGRSHRRWFTPAGTGLALSIILISPPLDPRFLSRLSGLGALAVHHALCNKYGLPVQIKWPNDILVDQGKLAGVLVETLWTGDVLKAVIIGIGINIAPESVNPVHLPPAELNLPATCVETALGRPVNQLEFLHAILYDFFFTWLPLLSAPEFIREWEAALAYHGQWVQLSTDNPVAGFADNPVPTEVGILKGLTTDGSLQILSADGRLITSKLGEVRLSPVPADHSFSPAA